MQNADGSTGYTPEPISSEGRYSKLLPSINLHAELTDTLLLRAAASQTLIRPALTDLAYRRTASFYDFDVYQPVNAEGAYKVSGVELNAVLPFGMFVDALEGFGVNANVTFLDSSLTGESDLGIPTSPIGLADRTYNATVYYDRGPLSARLSYNRKGAYAERIEPQHVPGVPRRLRAVRRLDQLPADRQLPRRAAGHQHHRRGDHRLHDGPGLPDDLRVLGKPHQPWRARPVLIRPAGPRHRGEARFRLIRAGDQKR
ncbi:MAG TPA: hypothetical protein VMQ93_14930 [Novosphingobium sp.]|nr:hypothetical protein [Novosphingobium sp.]